MNLSDSSPEIIPPDEGFEFALVNITYSKAQCTQYANSSSLSSLSGEEISRYNLHEVPHYTYSYGVGNCSLGQDVICEFDRSTEKTCRLSIRMSATITLTGCLTIKAIYMIIINIRARRRIKNKCLTFGDVVASVLYTNLQIRNECLLNAGEGNRHRVDHTCHKHCKDPRPSTTGDNTGHCQKCVKFNDLDKAADLLHPCIAIKYKKSLISNLGSTAISQMVILMLCSLGMLIISTMTAISVTHSAVNYNHTCHNPKSPARSNINCANGLQSFLKHTYGSFGGLNTSASFAKLKMNSLTSEVIAFAISNGAQLFFSALHLLLIYNITLISMEHDRGKFEMQRQRPRCTIVRGAAFEQSYLLQLPKKVLYSTMAFSATMHWLLGQAISTRELIITDLTDRGTDHSWEHSQYTVHPPLLVNYYMYKF